LDAKTKRARELRESPTEAERVLWNHIRRRQLGGHRFRRQHLIGPYVVDFFCFQKGLALEIDGGQHSERAGLDAERTAWLEGRGYQVLRFWNNQVQNEIEAVKEAILHALESA